MRTSAWISSAVIALLLLASAVFVVPEGHSALVVNLGRVTRADVGPGLHVKFPLVETVRLVDRRIALFPVASDRYPTADGRTIGLDFVAVGRVENMSRYVQATGGDVKAANERLAQVVKGALRGPIGTQTLQDVVANGRESLVAKQLAAINTGAAALGLRVSDVRIGRVDLPADGRFMADVYGRMRAQRQQAASLARAGGAEQAQRIRADADRDGVVIVAEAQRDAQRLRGEGEAEAARLYAEAAQKDPAFYAFERSLEAYRVAFGSGQAVIVLDRNDPFLKHLASDR